MSSQGPTTVTVAENGEGVFTQDVVMAHHRLIADEPEDMGGLDKGPAPYEFLLASLGACTVMTLRMYARQKQWPAGRIGVEVTHEKKPGADGAKVDVFTRKISIEGPLDDAQKQRMLEIANKCPVHRTLENHPVIESSLS